MSAALRQAALALRTVHQEAPALARSVRTSAGPRYHYDYEHGPNYLNFQDWPGRRAKVATWILGIIATGVGVPSMAIWWHQSKTRG